MKCRKTNYPTYKSADKARKSIYRTKRVDKLRIYRCQHGNHFHLTAEHKLGPPGS